MDKTLDPQNIIVARVPFYLVFARAHFVDLGTSVSPPTSDLTIKICGSPDSNVETPRDVKLHTQKAVGVGYDMNLGVDEWAVRHWIVAAGCGLRFQWTSPDGNNISWGLEVGIVKV